MWTIKTATLVLIFFGLLFTQQKVVGQGIGKEKSLLVSKGYAVVSAIKSNDLQTLKKVLSTCINPLFQSDSVVFGLLQSGIQLINDYGEPIKDSAKVSIMTFKVPESTELGTKENHHIATVKYEVSNCFNCGIVVQFSEVNGQWVFDEIEVIYLSLSEQEFLIDLLENLQIE